MKSVLANVKESELKMSPFPHVVIENVLDSDALGTLMQTFPSTETIVDGKEVGDNKRFDFTISDLRNNKTIDDIWRQFIEAQADRNFINDFVRIFRKGIQKYYPWLFEKYGQNLEHMKLGTRYIDSRENVDLLADAHISINTPVISKPSSVREAHLDDPLKLYGALLYMRLPEDDSIGGNLLLQKYKDKSTAKFFGQGISNDQVEVATEVQYKNNTLVFFLNTIDSLHGVTPRSITGNRRQFINFVAEMHDPLFDIKSKQENIWIRRLKTYKNLMSRKLFGDNSRKNK